MKQQESIYAEPPKLLYKYKSITPADRDETKNNGYTRKLLTEGELYFSRFSELSDPNEMLFSYAEDGNIITVPSHETIDIPNTTLIKKLDDGSRQLRFDGIGAAKRVREQLDKRWGVLCLTERNDDLLMFDYYANAHTGICVEIDWAKLQIVRKNTNGALQPPRKIKYSDQPPLISSSDTSNSDEIFYTKSKKYEHEKEWRLFFLTGTFKHPNVLSAITGIFFGCATSPQDKQLVKNWLKNRSDIKYYQAKQQDKKYELDIISI